MKLSRLFFCFSLMVLMPSLCWATDYFWKGADGANTSDSSNWSTNSSGACGTGGSGVPGSGDKAQFNTSCNNGATINADMTIDTFKTFSGYTGTITHSADLTVTNDFHMLGGTFVGSSDTDHDISVTDQFQIPQSGGQTVVFTAPAGTLTLSGTILDFGRVGTLTFNHNNGTVLANRTASGDVNFRLMNNIEFYNLTVSLAAEKHFKATSTNYVHIVKNDFSMTAGEMDNGSTGTWQFEGDVTLSNADNFDEHILLAAGNDQTFALGSATMLLRKLRVNKTGGIATLTTSDLTVDADGLDIEEGTFDVGGRNISNGANITVESGGVLRIQGGETFTGDPTFEAGSALHVDGTSNATLPSFGEFSDGDATDIDLSVYGVDGDEVFTLPAAWVDVDELDIDSGILDNGGNNLTVVGTFTNDATLRVEVDDTISITNDTDSGTIDYDAGTNTGLPVGNSYYNLTISGATATLNAALDVDNDLTISSGSLITGGNNITIAGDWSNSSTFTHGSALVTFDGTDQAIYGTTTFNSLTKTVSGQDTFKFEHTKTQTIAGTLTLDGGSDCSTELLLIRSTQPGTVFTITDNGSETISDVDVKDSTGTNSISAASGNYRDSGNNTNWSFGGTDCDGGGGNPADLTAPWLGAFF